jgi:diguanylate cyclase (GGDEF)-like protein
MSHVDQDDRNMLRVILVGRTGLEATLRLDEQLELVRVGTPLEAIGEASGVAEIGPPERSVVVFSEKARDELDADARARFSNALAIVSPGTRTAALGEPAEATNFDAALGSACSAGDLRNLFGGVQHRAIPADVPAAPVPPQRPDAQQVEPRDDQVEALLDRVFDEPAQTSTPVTGDEALVAQMLCGHGVTPLALDLLRLRVGDDSLEVHSGSEEREGTPVIWRGTRVATITADQASPAALSDAASWLAAWLALERQMAQLRQEAFTDPLTGAWNRRFFDRYIVGALNRALQDRRSVTLLMFDIDDFKHFNDEYGHAAGDLILRETVRLIESVIRPTDKVCRMGGDEFVVIFDDPKGKRDPASRHPESVFDIAHRFREQIAQKRFPVLGLEAPGKLAVSGGLATFPWDGRTATELLEAADRRTLQSKRQGKNVITIGAGGD